MFKKIFILLIMIGVLQANNEYDLKKDFHFFNYSNKVSSKYVDGILKMHKSNITDKQKQNIIYLFEKEKMIRDSLLVLYKTKYKYEFMPYIASLTQQHLYILKKFMNKYNIADNIDLLKVGNFNLQVIKEEYDNYLHLSKESKRTAGEISVLFMSNLIKAYNEIIYSKPPKDIKRILLKLNAFNKKVLHRFKKGLRNVELGLPVD